jgi:hypothetical protein
MSDAFSFGDPHAAPRARIVCVRNACALRRRFALDAYDGSKQGCNEQSDDQVG